MPTASCIGPFPRLLPSTAVCPRQIEAYPTMPLFQYPLVLTNAMCAVTDTDSIWKAGSIPQLPKPQQCPESLVGSLAWEVLLLLLDIRTNPQVLLTHLQGQGAHSLETAPLVFDSWKPLLMIFTDLGSSGQTSRATTFFWMSGGQLGGICQPQAVDFLNDSLIRMSSHFLKSRAVN